eukprot:s42_g25.t1
MKARMVFASRTTSLHLGRPTLHVGQPVVRGQAYWTPVDCWAAGVLLYMSLSATPPFYATSDAEVLQKVKHCLYKMEGSRWEHVSGESKSLIRQLMCFEQSSRATAQQALQHPFLKRYMAQAELRQPTPPDSKRTRMEEEEEEEEEEEGKALRLADEEQNHHG